STFESCPEAVRGNDPGHETGSLQRRFEGARGHDAVGKLHTRQIAGVFVVASEAFCMVLAPSPETDSIALVRQDLRERRSPGSCADYRYFFHLGFCDRNGTLEW